MTDVTGDGIRLKPIEPGDISAEQAPLAEKLQGGVDSFLHSFTTRTSTGAMIGPFNAMLHFPEFGGPVWDLFLALAGKSSLPRSVRETVILATGAAYGSLYELYSHEATSREASFDEAKIATLAAGERPVDLTREEQIAYDVAAVLNRGHQVPSSTYGAAVSTFGVQGAAEIAYLVACYGSISTLLNMFDVNLPGTELG